MALTVLIQAGHRPPLDPNHSHQTGASGEREFTWALQERLVKIIAVDPRLTALPMPGQIPAGTKADIALFLHADGGTAQSRGFHFGYPPDSAVSKQFAAKVRDEFLELDGHLPDRGTDNDGTNLTLYYGYALVDSGGPKLLVEHGFMTNAADRRWLLTRVSDLAWTEYVAVCRHFGLEPQAAPAPDADLAAGAAGGDVAVLQVRLNDLGYGPLATDGAFGNATKATVTQFQQANGLTADGTVGVATRKALAIASPTTPEEPRTLKVTTPPLTGPDVAQLQQRLNALRHGPLAVTGVFDLATDAVVRDFQREHDLQPDGVVGPRTRAALVAAQPRPQPAPASAAPIIRLESGATAPTLSYNVPDEVAYHGRNFVELKIDPTWFKDYAPPVADTDLQATAASLARPVEPPEPSTPSGGTKPPTSIELTIQSPMDDATVSGKLPTGALVTIAGAAYVKTGTGSIGSVAVSVGGQVAQVVPKATGDWSTWTATATVTSSGRVDVAVTAVHATNPNIKKDRTITIAVDVAPADQPRPEDGTPPTVSIDSPANNEPIVLPPGGRLTVKGTASDAHGNVAKIELAVGTAEWSALSIEPASTVGWSKSLELPHGEHVVRVRATDDSGNQSPAAAATLRLLAAAPQPPKTLRLLLVETYTLTAHRSQYGAGRVLEMLTMLPGESLKLFVKTYTSSEESRKESSSILDSWTDEASTDFETTTQREQTYKENFQEAEKYSVSGKAAANWGWGSASIEGSYSAGTNSAREEFAKNAMNSVRKHAAKASAARNVQVTAEHAVKSSSGEETTIERTIQNINVSRTLNVVARQLVQQYTTLLALTDARIACVREDLVPTEDGSGLESRWTYREATLPQLDALIDEYFVDDPDIRVELRDQIVHQLSHVWDHEDRHHSLVETKPLVDENGNVVSISSYLRFKKNYVSTYVDPLEPTAVPIRVRGVIVAATTTTMRTPAVVLDAFLGGGNALDTYSQSLQATAVQGREIANDVARSEYERNRLAGQLVAAENADGAKIFEQVFDVLRPVPPAAADGNGPA